MRHRLDVGTILLALGGALLLVALPFDWYGDDARGANAFDAFELVDWLLVGLALTLLGGAARAITGPPRVDVVPGWLAAAGAAVLVLVVAMALDPPPAVRGAERELGLWLALVAGALAAAGAALGLARISVAVDVRGRERRARVPAVDQRERPDRAPAAPNPAASEDLPADRGSTSLGGADDERTRVVADPPVDPERTQPHRVE